jgi:hypothetical protein
MKIQRRLLTVLAMAVLALLTAACTGVAPGGTGVNQGGPVVAPAAAKAAVEAAAHVTLVQQPGSDSDSTVYENTDTMGTDGQVAAVIVAKDAATVKIVADAMKLGFQAFGTLKTYTNKNVIVLYAAIGGTDNSSAVENAVKSL